MKARYGSISMKGGFRVRHNGSAIWREMVAKADDVICQTRWIVGDGRLINFMYDPWIAKVPLVQWSTFISMDILDSILVSNLLIMDGTRWNAVMVTWIFGDILVARVLSIILSVHLCSDVRVWRFSTLSRVLISDLYPLFCQQLGWIWRLAIHPRVSFFVWKVAWHHLPTRAFLIGKGLHLPYVCPACGEDGET